MNIIEKIKAKQNDMQANPAVTIAFLGDSVTHGSFEPKRTATNCISPVYSSTHAYSTHLQELLHFLYPSVQINIINSGICGDNAVRGAERLERDVLRYQPDLAVISYGLNDCTRGLENISDYTTALADMFNSLQKAGVETIFMTENMMNTYVEFSMQDPLLVQVAQELIPLEKDGILKAYFEAAKDVAAQHGVKVCDCYAKWRTLYEAGVDVTRLLTINHPVREMTWLFAYSLLETLFQD